MTIRPYLLPALAALLLIHAGCKKALTPEHTGQARTAARSLVDGGDVIIPTFDLPIRVDSPFAWGINGHPEADPAYFSNVPLQFSLIKQLQVGYYRFDVGFDNNGQAVSYAGNFSTLLSEAVANNIQLVPTINILSPAQLWALSADSAFTIGQQYGQNCSSVYGSYFNYYQLGNEEDIALLPATGVDGNNPSSYDPVKLAILASFFKGMIQGIKLEDPTARIIINCGGWYHYGYFLALNQAGVPYDILGYDWYADLGNYKKVLDSLQVKFPTTTVWFTECNDGNDVYPENDSAQNATIESYIQNLDQTSNIKGFFIYELFDEPDKADSSEYEANLGMLNWTTPYTAYTIKPFFETYKFKIEEQKNGWNDFVYSIYLYSNYRQPDPGGLQFWTNWFIQNRNIPEGFNIILPGENYARWVNQQYELFLNREADSTGLAYWTQQLVNGSTRESVIDNFVGGTEFWQLSGSTDTGFLNRAYAKLLNRPPTSAEIANWLPGLNSGTTATWQVAASVLASQEYLQDFVSASYNWYLRRNNIISPADLSWAVGLMQGGMTQLDFVKTLLNSYEFYARAIKEGYVRNNPGESF